MTLKESSLKPFVIKFRHLMVVKTGILLAGYPTEDLNKFRTALRKNLENSGLEFHEPYLNDICHSTLVRFADPLSDIDMVTVEKLLRDYGDCRFGEISVNSFRLGPSSWKMRREELKMFREIKI